MMRRVNDSSRFLCTKPRPVPQIRRFLNSDLPALVRLWNAHYQTQGFEFHGQVSAAVFEQAVLNRIFFHPTALLVATDGADGEAVGFAHWLENPIDPSVANIVALCVSPAADGCAVSGELLAACEAAAAAAGKSRCFGGAGRTDLTGYAGLPPLGPGEGVLDQDRRAVGWYMQAGFSPHQRMIRYRAGLENFRPPIDRSLMMFRRSTVMGNELVIPEGWRRAAALSHVDVDRFTAKTRRGETVAWAEILIGDPEVNVLPVGTAILDRWESNSSYDPQDATRFVISTALKELAGRGVRHIESVADDQHPDRARLLRSLSFQPSGEGTIFAKQLRAASAH